MSFYSLPSGGIWDVINQRKDYMELYMEVYYLLHGFYPTDQVASDAFAKYARNHPKVRKCL